MQTIIIPGKPIAKARPRFARRGKFVKTYNAQETEEGRVLWHLYEQWKGDPISGPVVLFMVFSFKRPKSHFGTGRNVEIKKKSAPFYNIKKPDIDNIIKFYCDCMNGIVYEDDRQIIYCRATKAYGAKEFIEIDIGGVEDVD